MRPLFSTDTLTSVVPIFSARLAGSVLTRAADDVPIEARTGRADEEEQTDIRGSKDKRNQEDSRLKRKLSIAFSTAKSERDIKRDAGSRLGAAAPRGRSRTMGREVHI
jgi:hypothetical protein